MQIAFSQAIASMLFLAAAFSAPSAIACIDIAPFEIEDIRQADAIFSGRLVRYERVSPGRPNSLTDYALLTVHVDRVIKGNVPKEVQLYWWNSTFGVPKEKRVDSSLLIAAVSAGRRMLPLRGGSASVFPTRRADLLQLMQAPCSMPFLLDDTEQNTIAVRDILRHQTVPPRNYFAVQMQVMEHDAHVSATRRSQNKKLAVALSTVLAVAIALAVIAGWMRK